MPTPATLTRAEAQAIIREFLDEGGLFIHANHLYEREEMSDVNPREVERAIYKGNVCRDPYVNQKYDNWEVRVSAKIDGREIVLGVAIDDDGSIRRRRTITVTTVWKDR